MWWHKNKNRKSGGYWRCTIRRRENERKWRKNNPQKAEKKNLYCREWRKRKSQDTLWLAEELERLKELEEIQMNDPVKKMKKYAKSRIRKRENKLKEGYSGNWL